MVEINFSLVTHYEVLQGFTVLHFLRFCCTLQKCCASGSTVSTTERWRPTLELSQSECNGSFLFYYSLCSKAMQWRLILTGLLYEKVRIANCSFPDQGEVKTSFSSLNFDSIQMGLACYVGSIFQSLATCGHHLWVDKYG